MQSRASAIIKTQSLLTLAAVWLRAFAAKRLLPRPLVLIALGFCGACGIAASGRYLTLAAFTLLLASLTVLIRSREPRIVSLALLFLGFGLGCVRLASTSIQPTLVFSGERLVKVKGTVATLPQERSFTTLFTLQASAMNVNSHWTQIDTRIGVRLLGGAQEKARGIDEGDSVTLNGILSHDPKHGESEPEIEIVSRAPDDVSIANPSLVTFGQRISSRLSRKCKAILNAELGSDDSATMIALLLGDRSRMDPRVSSAFVDTGAAHLLATAGLHVGIIVWSLGLLFRLMTVPRKSSAALCILAIWGYAVMAGGRPAVERAAFVASVYYVAVIFERIPDLPSALALCAIVTLWVSPNLIADSGFQMTFITVIGIVALMTPMTAGVEEAFTVFKNTWLTRLTKRFIELELLSVAAQASAAPLVAYYFNIVAAGSVIANLIAVPIMVLLLPSALIAVLVGAIYLPLGTLAAHCVVAPLLHCVVGSVTWVANAPWATLSVLQPSSAGIVCYYAVLIGGSFAASSLQSRHSQPNVSSTGGDHVAQAALMP